jgi:hypothetical protein
MKSLKLVFLALFSLTLGGCVVVPYESNHRVIQRPLPQIIVVHEYPRYYYSYPTVWWNIGVRHHRHR